MKKPTISPGQIRILKERIKQHEAHLCKPGTHDLRVSGTSQGRRKSLSCRKCRFMVMVPLDATERKALNIHNRAVEKETKAIHGLGWKFQKEFYLYEDYRLSDEEWEASKLMRASIKPHKGSNLGKYLKPSRIRKIHRGFKWSGHELMTRMEKFAKRHPKDVELLTCDDVYAAGSFIMLIHRRSAKEYYGTNVIIAPQMGPFPATEVFLYPGHSEALLKALKAIPGEAKEKESRYGFMRWGLDKVLSNSIPAGFKAEGL